MLMSRGMFNVMCLRVTARAGGRTARVSRGMHEEGGGCAAVHRRLGRGTARDRCRARATCGGMPLADAISGLEERSTSWARAASNAGLEKSIFHEMMRRVRRWNEVQGVDGPG